MMLLCVRCRQLQLLLSDAVGYYSTVAAVAQEACSCKCARQLMAASCWTLAAMAEVLDTTGQQLQHACTLAMHVTTATPDE